MAMRFDEEASRKVEALYLTPDIVAQREAVLSALALRPGERVVDLGCGPGLLLAQMRELVGEQGELCGIDVSESMIALAKQRCAAWSNVDIGPGDVTRLPCGDASFDAAVCTQVYEYVADVDMALSELCRVLKPGGRAVIVDTDWESCVWHSSDSARMRRVLEAWDLHCPHPHLPRSLRRRLQRAGLDDIRCAALTLLNAEFAADTYSFGMIDVIARSIFQ